MGDGWDESARGWIEGLGEHGDWARRYVLDPAMLRRVDAGHYRSALDVGCGEGRFCRTLNKRGIRATGVDPTQALLREARRRDPQGDYIECGAESLPFADSVFDLVVSYLSLIDIQAYEAAIREMARVLKADGTLLIANLAAHASANPDGGWLKDYAGKKVTYRIDDYLTEHWKWAAWGNIRIKNWHRPLSAYVRVLLSVGLSLVFFDEPPAVGADAASTDEHRRVPLFVVTEWRKASVPPESKI
jgi:ubiquinone/menaquinone biosynthesis C-methylase UbiE